jgi:hypothetical protein
LLADFFGRPDLFRDGFVGTGRSCGPRSSRTGFNRSPIGLKSIAGGTSCGSSAYGRRWGLVAQRRLFFEVDNVA